MTSEGADAPRRDERRPARLDPPDYERTAPLVQFLEWLQRSAFAVWVGESPSIWAYPTILTLHTVGLALVVGSNAVLDLRLLGAGRRIPLAALESVFRPLWIGFAINAPTGVALFVASAEFTGTKPIFYVKLGFVFLGLGTARLLQRVVYGHRDHVALDGPIPIGTKVLAACSLILWAAAITAGRYTAYVE